MSNDFEVCCECGQKIFLDNEEAHELETYGDQPLFIHQRCIVIRENGLAEAERDRKRDEALDNSQRG